MISHEIFSRITNEHALWECSEKAHVNIGQALERKYYYVLGQLAAVSNAFVGCGPECLHEEFVNYMFHSPLSVEFTLADARFKSHLVDIEKGIFNCLYEALI